MRRLFCILSAGLIAAAPVAGSAAPAKPADPLTEVILAADAAFFDLYFDRCDPARMAASVDPAVEFYHDKGGVVAVDAKALVADYAKSCTEKLKPDAWRSRRAIDAATVRVDPVPGYGAIEEGEHRFFERRGDGPERLAGHARFLILWKDDGGTWKPARIFSYAHRAAVTK
jgi:Domain of unknown function (DUF4440)